MEQKNGSGSSEHLNLESDVTSSIRDEDPIDHDKMVGRGSSSSISSSSSVSTSYELELDYGENDMIYTEFEVNGSSSPRSNPESTSTTPKSISASPQARGATLTTETSDLNSLNASPKQSPPIQMMRQPSGYDPNRIPLSIFTAKERNNSEWSLASNESLFSIKMGNNSFSMDNGFYISKSGKLNWLDDGLNYSCFTPDANKSSDFTTRSPSLPTTVKKAAADAEWKSASSDGESGEKEELLETHNALPIDSEKEEESSPSRKGLQLPSPSLTVPEEKGASPTEEPLNSDGSAKSTSSFTFPVLAGGSPTKVDGERSPPTPSTPLTPKGAAETKTTSEAPPSTTPKAGGNQWFNCFSCFPICC